ncbi:hypothetical protein PIB30_078841 [Stylosanthes scabra]|uniref:Uncharacterized protein n=1 Tax=Stylosanthes scabra TaxID=79078 RepID=A0ABU6RQS8_9FABA|nr:hypothetical protein [Stylosanthes scabra]
MSRQKIVKQIYDNIDRKRPMFRGLLKSDLQPPNPALPTSSSKDPQDPASSSKDQRTLQNRKNEERKLTEQETKFGSKTEEALHAYAWKSTHMRATQGPLHA